MSKNTNLSFLTDFITADIVNSRVGINNASPQTTFDVTGTGKFSGILTLGSTISNGTYAYTLPSATGTLALTSDIPSVSGYVPYTGATQAVNLGYNSLSASFLRIDGAGPTLGSYLGFKHSTNVTTGADGYTSIYTFGTNTIAFKSVSGATTRDFSFSMASITPGVPGGRTYTLPDADGTLALTSQIPANPVGGTGTAGQVTYWSSSSEITGISNFLFNASERNLTIDRSLSTLGNAITISKGSDVDQAWLAFRQGGGASGVWRLGYSGDPYDFRISAGSDSSLGTQALRIFEDSQNVVVGTAIVDNGTKLQVGGSVNIVGNGSQLLFDSLGQSKSGGIYYTNDFELLINNSRGVGSAIYLGNVNMDFHTNVSGNPRLRITSGGNILVGTTTDNGARLQLGGFSGAVNQNNGIKLTNNVGTIVGLEIGGSNDSYIGTISASNFSIRTANTPIITAASSGNVGIGTSSPSTILQANFSNSNAYSSGVTGNGLMLYNTSTTNNQYVGLYFLGEPAAGNAGQATIYGITTGSGAMDLAFSTRGSSILSERMRITSGGDVNFLGGAVRADGGYFAVRTSGGSAVSGYLLREANWLGTGTSTNLALAAENAGGELVFFTGGQTTTRMKITSGGNVLIGTTTDSGYKLRVNGMSYLDGYNYASSIQYTRAVSNTVNPAGGEGVLIFSGGQAAMRMNSSYTMNFDMYNSGNQFTALQIRQTGNTVQVNSPDNQLSLEIAYQGSGHGYLGATASYGRALLAYSQNGGYVYLSSSSTWVNASDRNRKKNFENYNKGLSEICSLKPTLFNLKNQSDDMPKIAGLIAQEVGEHLPEAFSDGEFIGIDYSVLTVTMINAIKELKQQLDTLRNENN